MAKEAAREVREIDARDFDNNFVGLAHEVNMELQKNPSAVVLNLYNGSDRSPYSSITRQLPEYDFGRPGDSVLVKRTDRSYVPCSGR